MATDQSVHNDPELQVQEHMENGSCGGWGVTPTFRAKEVSEGHGNIDLWITAGNIKFSALESHDYFGG